MGRGELRLALSALINNSPRREKAWVPACARTNGERFQTMRAMRLGRLRWRASLRLEARLFYDLLRQHAIRRNETREFLWRVGDRLKPALDQMTAAKIRLVEDGGDFL